MVEHLPGKTVVEGTTEGMTARLLLSSLAAVFVLVGFSVYGSAIAQDTTPGTAPNANQNAASENIVDRAALASLQSQLTNLEQLPLLPTPPANLTADSTQISSTELSEPSFAWIRDQSDERYHSSSRLVEQWSAYTTPQGIRYVDVIVDRDAWEQLSYVRRYGFLVQFGTAAQNNRHQLRIFHSGDVINRLDEISAQGSSFGIAVGSSVRVRGAYYCIQQATPPVPTLSTAQTVPQACGAQLSPLINL